MPTTRKRSQWWDQAIQCWRSQSYPSKHLLVGSEDADALERIPVGDGIGVLHCPRLNSLGAKRNWINRHVTTPLIAHWDDDDWSHADRLTDQIDRLVVSGLSVTGYREMEFSGPGGRWYYAGAANYVLGTSLLYRRDWWERWPFPGVSVGEDTEFVKTARNRGQLAVADGVGMMMARDHPGNTSARQYGNKEWRRL